MVDVRLATPRSMWLLSLALGLAPTPCAAQFDTTGWRFAAREARVETFRGREALVLRDGAAWIPDSSFENGTIEFDIALSDSAGFAGVQFRMEDEDDYEHFYVRGHMSGNPDATQYQPVFHGNSGWQIYVGDRYNAPLRFRFDGWMHVRLIVDGMQAVVSVDGAEQYIPALVRAPRPGMVGLAASVAAARFANVQVHSALAVPVARHEVAALPAPSGTLTPWSVSSLLEEKRLVGRTRLDPADERGLTWTRATPTERGIVNLGMLTGQSGDSNTVIAALSLTSASARTVRLRLGYSDRVRVFLDGRLLYAGNDGFRSRDYRFLGTVGLFDEIALPLAAGVNSLWFAVSESFGGWAVTAAIEDQTGVVVGPGCGRITCRR